MDMKDERLIERRKVIQASPLFADLHIDEQTLLAELCSELEFKAEELIVREGEPGDSLFILMEGAVRVFRATHANGSSGGDIAVMKEGEFFGEMSMLEKSVRSASVQAATDVRLLSLTTEDLYSFSRIHKNGFTVVIINIARILSQRLRQTTMRLKGIQ
jgi:CRP-like cAMP-binding protein